jgi:SAM-dependent methyltransferase
MGLDFNSVKFLLWAKNLGVSFERTLTLGHQGLGSSRSQFCRVVRDFGMKVTPEEADRVYTHPPFTGLFADEFLHFLGAKEAVSVDCSDFEGATLLHDLNKPFPEHLRGSFDLVVDGGTLEHIFNYQKALFNCLDLLRIGGHFVTVTPATGQMGHGFYQFSPELFFRVFSPERGFALRKIILFECAKTDSAFYEVKDPATTGHRTSSPARPMQLAVLARKISETPTGLEPPQQSDYAAIWEEHKKKKAESKSTKTSSSGLIQRLRVALNPYWPTWLREWRDACLHRWRWNRGLAEQRTLRHFRRISHQEIFSERSG